MSDRPHIPDPLQRELMMEAGYRCAICKTPEPLVIEHIVEWAKVQVHEFGNIIVLCANCHGRKKNTSDPRHINTASLKKIKSDLMLLNGRYSDLERRIIEQFGEQLSRGDTDEVAYFVPERMAIMVKKLIDDGLVITQLYQNGITNNFNNGVVLRDDTVRLILTTKGRNFVEKLMVP